MSDPKFPPMPSDYAHNPASSDADGLLMGRQVGMSTTAAVDLVYARGGEVKALRELERAVRAYWPRVEKKAGGLIGAQIAAVDDALAALDPSQSESVTSEEKR